MGKRPSMSIVNKLRQNLRTSLSALQRIKQRLRLNSNYNLDPVDVLTLNAINSMNTAAMSDICQIDTKLQSFTDTTHTDSNNLEASLLNTNSSKQHDPANKSAYSSNKIASFNIGSKAMKVDSCPIVKGSLLENRPTKNDMKERENKIPANNCRESPNRSVSLHDKVWKSKAGLEESCSHPGCINQLTDQQNLLHRFKDQFVTKSSAMEPLSPQRTDQEIVIPETPKKFLKEWQNINLSPNTNDQNDSMGKMSIQRSELNHIEEKTKSKKKNTKSVFKTSPGKTSSGISNKSVEDAFLEYKELSRAKAKKKMKGNFVSSSDLITKVSQPLISDSFQKFDTGSRIHDSKKLDDYIVNETKTNKVAGGKPLSNLKTTVTKKTSQKESRGRKRTICMTESSNNRDIFNLESDPESDVRPVSTLI